MDANKLNEKAWNTGAYQAWLQRFGTPQEAAQKIKKDPLNRLGTAAKFIGADLQHKKIINLLGSNGNKAVALALLGADVTIVDFSVENERYARELAQSAGVKLRYIQSDVLQLAPEERTGDYDIVFMEFGILHYFMDLTPLFAIVSQLLKTGGQLVLQDFHPVSTKLLSSKGTTAKIRKHKVTGNYFDTALEEKEVSFSKFLPGAHGADPTAVESQKVYLRNWTLGEIITAIAKHQLYIQCLEELPNQSSAVFDQGIPKTFTLTAEKIVK